MDSRIILETLDEKIIIEICKQENFFVNIKKLILEYEKLLNIQESNDLESEDIFNLHKVTLNELIILEKNLLIVMDKYLQKRNGCNIYFNYRDNILFNDINTFNIETLDNKNPIINNIYQVVIYTSKILLTYYLNESYYFNRLINLIKLRLDEEVEIFQKFILYTQLDTLEKLKNKKEKKYLIIGS